VPGAGPADVRPDDGADRETGRNGRVRPGGGPAPPLPVPEGRVRLRVEAGAGARCRFLHDVGDGPRPSAGPVFAATPWRWVGAVLGLFATAPAGTGPAGTATFTRFRIDPL
ncbi:hypothetical protein ABTX35_33840, partial [Streptomyces sp. NPDC096080]